MRGTRILGGAAVAAVLVAAGCGSSSTTTATDTWATGVCTAITTWQSQLTSIENTVKSGAVTKDSINSAVTQAKDATDELAKSLKKLGKPDTQVGQQAQDQIDTLTTQLQTDVDTIKSAAEGVSGVGGVTAAVTTATTTVSKMKTQINATITSLKQLDAKGALATAFQQSSSCQKLKGGG